MSQSSLEWRSEASEEELRGRATEMRAEWTELSRSDRESDSYRSAKSQFLTEMEDIDVQLTLRGVENGASPRYAPAGVHSDPAGAAVERRTIGQQVVDNEEFKSWMSRASHQGDIGRSPTVEVRTLVAEGSGTAGTLLPVGQPFLANVRRRKLFVRDLVTVQQTNLSAIPYVRELNAATNQTGASTVAENLQKPEATIEFQPDTAVVQVIATSIPITRQIMEDAPTLRGYIDGRLQYLLDFREEDEILRGNGISPDLPGVLNFSGVQTQSTAGAGEYAITLGNAIAKVEAVDMFPDGVAMNPVTFWNMVTHRAAAGSGTFDAGAFSSAPIQYVWGLPIVRTNSLNANQNLVGNFQLGLTLFDRSEQGVRVYEQHSDWAKYNKILLLAEKRVALACNRPDAFVIATTS